MFPAGDGPDASGLGGADLSSLMAQAAQMQQQLMAAQEQLASTQVTGSAGGGLVRATVTGAGEVVGLKIDPSAVDPPTPRAWPTSCWRRSGTATARRPSCSSRHGPARRGSRRRRWLGGLGLPGL